MPLPPCLQREGIIPELLSRWFCGPRLHLSKSLILLKHKNKKNLAQVKFPSGVCVWQISLFYLYGPYRFSVYNFVLNVRMLTGMVFQKVLLFTPLPLILKTKGFFIPKKKRRKRQKSSTEVCFMNKVFNYFFYQLIAFIVPFYCKMK